MAETETMAEPERFDPLADWRDRLTHAGRAGLQVDVAPPLAQITLRGDPGDAAFSGAVARATGLAPPATPNTLGTEGPLTLLWLGPDEFLLLAPAARGADLLAALEAALAEVPGAVAVDTGETRRAIDLWGPDARLPLEAGCALDLHPRVFPVGSCAQGLVGGLPVLVAHAPRRNGTDQPCLRLLTRTSLVRHLAWWLTDALAEFRRRRG